MDIDPNPTTGEVLRYLRRRTGQLADKIHEYRHLYHQNSLPFCKKNADAFFALDRVAHLLQRVYAVLVFSTAGQACSPTRLLRHCRTLFKTHKYCNINFK